MNFKIYNTYYLLVPGVISLIAILVLAIWGLHPSIDLKGGALLQVSYPQGRPAVEDVRAKIAPMNLGEIRVQPSGENAYIVRTRDLSTEEKNQLEVAMGELGQIHEDQYNSVGPVIGAELLRKGLIALGLVAISIILFIAFAFRKVSKPVASWKYGIIAIITLIHDILIPVGLFAFLGEVKGSEVDSLFIVALLTLLGVSINNTIVVFDRIRENLRRNEEYRKKEDFVDTVGRSIMNTLARSMNTTITVIIVLIALYFLGPIATRDFSLTLIVGMIAGAYSSIFLASPLLVLAEKWQAPPSKK